MSNKLPKEVWEGRMAFAIAAKARGLSYQKIGKHFGLSQSSGERLYNRALRWQKHQLAAVAQEKKHQEFVEGYYRAIAEDPSKKIRIVS